MCNANQIYDNRKALLNSHSISSFSSSGSTKIAYSLNSSAERNVDRGSEDKELRSKCWRKCEIDGLILEGDEISIGLLCRFGLYNDDFAELRGIGKFYPQTEDSLSVSMNWDLNLPQLVRDGPASAASTLSEKSCNKFKLIDFEEFVRKAWGVYSAAVAHFLFQYEILCVMLYWNFARDDEHRKFLFQLKECLEGRKADPFLYAATVTALESDSTEQTDDVCSKLETALSLVIRPLQRTLQKPDPARIILRELEVSKARFIGHFYTAKVDWDMPFDDRTEILGRLKHIGVSAQAQVLSGEDHAFYKQLDTQSEILDPQSLCEINDRWNRLCHSVKEYMDTCVVSEAEMNQFAQELYRHRNIFSFTAVILGMEASQSRAHAKQQHSYLLEPSRDYNLVANLKYMTESYPVNGFASSDETKGHHFPSTSNALEDTGVMSYLRDMVRQVFLGGSLFGCFGR
ncbi:hypothetical protein PMG11_11170 [Penicillium brasilianum]|uniref:Ras-GEF domain-containing protein n=1 Tax=Penicillium brasilianum TaxID=104259 RepID=A0A0F7U5F2_PENBI|nr:hypothetical protein PMG11_11170 [Penicillium brasilianum]